MNQYNLLPLLALTLAIHGFAMYDETPKDTKVRIDVGGYQFTTTVSTILQTGGSLLNRLMQEANINKSKEIPLLFVDRLKLEGKLIDRFMRYKNLPKGFDSSVAREASEFFEHDAMKQYIQTAKKESKYYIWESDGKNKLQRCPKCDSNVTDYLSAVSHLKTNHHTKISGCYKDPRTTNRLRGDFVESWGIFFKSRE